MLAPLLAAFLAGAPPAPSPAIAAVLAKPHWRVDWDSRGCVLLREGGERDPVLMVRFVPGNRSAEVWISDPRWTASAFAARPDVALVLAPVGGPPVEHPYFLKFGTTGHHALAVPDAGEDFLDRLAKAGTIAVRRNDADILTIRLPGAAAAVAAVRQCEDTILERWGVDPAAFHALRQRPQPLPNDRWFSPSDYPEAAVKADKSGATVVRVDIDASGKATGCTVEVASGSANLDNATCAGALRRGKFAPAIGPDGRAVAAPMILVVRWMLFG